MDDIAAKIGFSVFHSLAGAWVSSEGEGGGGATEEASQIISKNTP